MSYQPQDFYFRKAKSEGYAARSVYKLKAIDEKYQLLRKGMQIVDLGAAPGSWTQYIMQRVGQSGKILAIDIEPLAWRPPEWVRFERSDVFSSEVESLIEGKGWDGIVSDMAPRTTGVRITDHTRSAELVWRSLTLARKGLRTGGFWIAKLLEGPTLSALRQEARTSFARVEIYRPPATRIGSTECFLIGLSFQP
ncbi:MAG: RlmE family RNA methyltransferase [Bacteroidia bacterium]|nr:RlmE family RNA methyltransferase [Bacteroidia bacterium]MDW8235673.1 RlmE family RNA methyltransferase [Bacteroidia bacterium]